jgi:acyl-[acyl-carrier-protein]-phospholipid O-acyltransferase / long-chain-fatty-acid--[acyl-carrier-protein] ligase
MILENIKIMSVRGMRLLIRSHMRSFNLLNASQFLGALNDNIFKLLVIYLLINLKGPLSANTILSIAGAVFVAPFLLFSSGSGVLADKISKRNIIVSMKALEVVLMASSLIAVHFRSEFFLYFILFMMGAQSAIFGPSKYGIIPELVEEKKVSKANGSLSSLTYLAIILGTFLASFVTDITRKNFQIVSCLCILIAIAGFITSLGITKTAPKHSKKKINPLFLYEIYQTLELSLKRPHLFPAILASAFFLFIGAYVQLNIIPFAMQSLYMSEVGGGYLFLFTAVGIAIGCRIAGRISKEKPELGLSCIAGFLIVAIFILLGIFSTSFLAVIILLLLLGIFGGMFLVPMDSFIQVASPDKRRGQVIAASNFLSFTGVLLASLVLYILNQQLELSSARSFVAVGFLTLLFQLIVSGRMSHFFFPYFSRNILNKFYSVDFTDTPKPGSILVLQKKSWLTVCLLFRTLDSIRIFLPARAFQRFPWFNGWVDTVQMVKPAKTEKATLEKILSQAIQMQNKDQYILVLLDDGYSREEISSSYQKVSGFLHSPPSFISVDKEKKAFSLRTPLMRKTYFYTFS